VCPADSGQLLPTDGAASYAVGRRRWWRSALDGCVALLRQVLSTLDNFLGVALQWLMTATIAGAALLTICGLASRELAHSSITWELPVLELVVAVVAFLGGAAAYQADESVRLDVIRRRLPDSRKPTLDTFADWFVLGLAVVVTDWAAQSYPIEASQTIPGLSISAGILEVLLSVGMGLTAFFALTRVINRTWRQNVIGIGPLVLVVVVFSVIGGGLHFDAPGTALAVATTAGVVAIVLSIPLTFGVLLVPAIFLVLNGAPDSFVTLGIQAGVSSYIILAIPFFILAGAMVVESGVTQAIVRLLRPTLGRVPGGILQLTIGVSFVFSGMTGAKLADVVAVGTAMRDSLRSEGCTDAEATALLSAAAAAGETVPPSIALLVLGTVTSIPVAALFMAGIVPAVVVGALLAAFVAWRFRGQRLEMRRHGQGRESALRPLRGRDWAHGLAALGLPVLLVGGIEQGTMTPTEASACAVGYALLLLFATKRRKVQGRSLLKAMRHASVISGLVLLLVGVANSFAAAAALATVPQRIASAFAGLGASPTVFLLLTIALMVVAGAVLEGVAAVLVFGPLLVPVATTLGISLTQFGIVFILALGIGTFSPLLGIGFYSACRVMDAEPSAATRRFIPYLAVLLAAVVLVALVPVISTGLPSLLGLPG
jgi:tripartite ATP-independent transporter DctM subunit